MWWSDPAKEVLNIVFNRVLAPYVENLDMGQVNYGIGQGRVTLSNLRLKKGALDKFRLPVDVIEGHLGKFTLSLHWMNLGNQPVEVLVEDVYLLVVPSAESTYDSAEEEKRQQAAKMERIENAELLHVRGKSDVSQGELSYSEGLISSLIAKIINNLQVSVKNIHIRYEDKMSVPGHPFAAGATLAGFTAASVNEKWQPAFIDSKAGTIHKLSKLESLAMYFDTDAESMAGLSHAQFIKKFTEQISRGDYLPDHQFILKPVTGEGRITMNRTLDKETPRFDVQLLFDEIGVILDDNQYRDAISLVDMYHFYMRQHQYQKFRPKAEQLNENRPRALLQFAGRAILDEVHEHRRRWTWAYFAERRNERHRYVELFKKKQQNALVDPEQRELDAFEKKLSYEDIRFYRSIARSQLRKDMASRRKIEEEKKQQAPAQTSWSSWIWGSSGSSSDGTTEAPPEDSAFTGEMTEEQRKQLYEALDYDEKTALTESFETPRDALKARVLAQLNRGSFALKRDPHGANTEIISIVSDVFQATFVQRPDNFETSVSLSGFAVYDSTSKDTLYKRIVHVQERRNNGGVVKTQVVEGAGEITDMVDPFFYLRFENNPLDERADSALEVKMRYMEIVYHRGYVEAIYKFFRPPAGQIESVEALLDVASQTLEGLRKETRAGLEYALQTHKTVDVHMDLNAPIIIVPEDITTNNCKHLLIDAGHISVVSQLGNKEAIKEIQSKRKLKYTDEDYQRLESMMYDKLSVRLKDAQFLLGNDLQSCLDALSSERNDKLHLLERVTLDLQVQNSIVPTAYNLARFKISGHLPSLQVNLSDTKYKALMRLVDVSVPHFDDSADTISHTATSQRSNAFKLPSGFFGASEKSEYNVDDAEDGSSEAASSPKVEHEEQDEEFYDAADGVPTNPALHQHIVEFDFTVDVLRACLSKSGADGVEKAMGDVSFSQFGLVFAMAKHVMTVDVHLSSISMNVFQSGKSPLECISSAVGGSDGDLLVVKYVRVDRQSPEYVPLYNGIDQSVNITTSTFIFRAAPEPVISLYEFIMTTFVPEKRADAAPSPVDSPQIDNAVSSQEAAGTASDKINVSLKLASVQVYLINNDVKLATLSLSTADVTISLRANAMHIGGRLGSLDLHDDSELTTFSPAFKQILSIEGDNFANFQYQTFDPNDQATYTGIKSAFYLNTGSLKLHYLEQPLHDIYLFITKLAKLKGLYDAAAEAAAQRASEIERMHFDVTIKSPIVVFPFNPEQSMDMLSLRLGELSARNDYEGTASRVTASLRGVQLASKTYNERHQSSFLKIVDDIDMDASVVQTNGIDRAADLNQPDTQVAVKIPDVRLHLTQLQYKLLMDLAQSIPRALAGAPEGSAEASQSSAVSVRSQDQSVAPSPPAVDLQPELRVVQQADGARVWTTIDVLLTIGAVKLHLYDEQATSEVNLKEHGIARFALSENSLRTKVLSDGAIEAQVIMKSMTMNNTRPGHSKFREIMPAAEHDRNQVMLLYTRSGGNGSALAVLTVDSPKVIFAVDPIIALLEFFTSAIPSAAAVEGDVDDQDTGANSDSSQLDFRLDLHAASVSVLQDDSDPETQAIRLAVKQVQLSQQFRGSFDGLRLVLIGDLHEQPLLHVKVKPFILGAKDWSGELRATSTLALHTSYWNITNSHWEPLIDPWTFSASVARNGPSGSLTLNVSARERLDVNITTTFIELALATIKLLGQEGDDVLRKARGSYAPYRIYNRTGSSIFVWSDLDGSSQLKDTTSKQIANGRTIDWRFDDWKTIREHVTSSGNNSIGMQFVGKPWEQLRSIPVDREGEYTFSLRPRTDKFAYRLLAEVRVQENTKVVTLRSVYNVVNDTLYPLEVTLVDESGQPMHPVEKIAPGQDFAVPIEAVNTGRIRVQPDQGFGYKWSPATRWEDLVTKRRLNLKCPHSDPSEAAFRFQTWVETDASETSPRKIPRITVKLRAPIELENLLPYNLDYRIYDKNTDQNWRSYLRKGGVMPVHSVELGHLILLNVHVQDTSFKQSEFAIINTDGNSDFDVENRLILRDSMDRKLDLRLNYVDQGRDFAFKVGESTWSQVVALEAPAADTRLVIPAQTRRSEEIQVGLSWSEGVGKYKLTKVIVISPRFIIKNNSSAAIAFREHGVAPRGKYELSPGERHPLHFIRSTDEKLLTMAYPGLNAQWSAPINMEDIGSMHFRLQKPGGVPSLMRADVRMEGSSIFIFISDASEGWPFTIENDSDSDFAFSQTDHTRTGPEPTTRTYPVYRVPRKSSVDYAWDFPAARDKKIILVVNDSRRAIDIMEIGDLVPFRFNDRQTVRAVSLDVRADGHKQVLRITNYNPAQSLYRPKRSNSVTLTRQDTMSSSQDGFEAVQEEVQPSLSVALDFEGIGVSLINRKMTEVVYVSANVLKFEYADSAVSQSVNMSCGSLQIDNQLHDALFPVLLQPTPISKESAGVASLPTIQGSTIWLKDQEHGVFFVKYCSILLQALTIEADEDFLYALYDLTQIKGAFWDEGQEDVLIPFPEDIKEPELTTSGQDLYFEVLELQPIRLAISFMRTERLSSEDKLSIRNPFAVVINAIAMAIGNINDAPLEMNALAIKDMRLTLPDLQERIMHHYRQEVLRQLYRIIGSADFIGNPVGLFNNVSSGVADIFYEPFNGAVMHGNSELGVGIAKGAASFVKKTVFGFSDSMTKFTSSVGKGLSATTFDPEYQLRRRMNQRRNRPRHAIYGVTAGAEAFASSVASGMEGVLLKPLEGAESEGAKGFFKGVGKGLIGAVTKPVIGVFDLASNPRLVPSDGVLVPYSEREALGQYWMKDLNNGAYRQELYVAHINLPGSDNVVLLTTTRILSFWSNKLRLEWDLPFTLVQGVTIEDTGIRFAHKSGKDHDKFAFIPDKNAQSWFFGQVATVVKAFNARRRMDS
ncbi:hypothetical protein EVJ58_g8935 [Rhodofomes roseus]|uniref:Vacuolar protein sorting-associated protein 13 n=1 Tax=Rhodofomes roseus TaxID=34475 RepID=A0A4Y9XW52_9APHY|nr:hypothetical protein EVJ58_g8935 [Rhodofomes roseus]